MISKIIKLFKLLRYTFSEKYYAKRDGFYIQISTKYHQISKSFSLYYLEGDKYICSFDGIVEGNNFVLDLNNPKPFGNQPGYLLRSLNMPLIQKRISEYIRKYHANIKIKGASCSGQKG